MSNQNPDSGTGELDMEHELAAAMSDFAGRYAPPAYRAASFGRAARRRRTVFALAAVSVLAVAGGVVALTTHGSSGSPNVSPGGQGTVPAPAATSAAAPSLSTPSATRLNDSGALAAAGPDSVLRKLLVAAELYDHPNTRSRVDLTQVAALFVDDAAFHRVWGTDGLGVTCGDPVDGALINGAAPVFLFKASSIGDKAVDFTFNATSDKVASASCHPATLSADEQVEDYYGGLVSAYGYADATKRQTRVTQLEEKYLVPALRTDNSAGTAATCQQTMPHTWVADTPSAGTTVWGWTVTLDGGASFQVNYGTADGRGSTGNLITSVTCP